MSSANTAADNNANSPQAGAGRPLPKKESDAFRSVVKHYEMKQYKKAIKQADSILKKYPNHGETLAMKGLTLNYMTTPGINKNKQQDKETTKREEAHALVKLGLRNDMRSHVCWHVYGLLHRSDHNYGEAIKAYKQALRIDQHNLQILRDLSMLQIQMRDLQGFLVTRNTLLTLKSNAKINWMAFALAKHMCGDLRGAVKVIDIYLGTLTEESEELGRCYESSELALYKNSILAEIPNNYKEALDHLNVCEGIVVNRTSWLFSKATYQLKLRDYVGAKQSTMALFQRGLTENYKVHSMYMCIVLEINDENVIDEALNGLKGTQTLVTMMPLTKEQKQLLRDAYQNELLSNESISKNSLALHRIPMTLSLFDSDDNSNYEEVMEALYIRCKKDLRKGVPSLVSELQSHIWVLDRETNRYVPPCDPVDYRNHPLYQRIVTKVDTYVSSLESTPSKFDANDEKEEPPSTLMWAWFLRAGLHELVGEYTAGITLCDKCLDQKTNTPTTTTTGDGDDKDSDNDNNNNNNADTDAVDVYELKARMLKAGGGIQTAVDCLEKGRELDKQDRYVNNLATKYMLQAGNDEQALKTISLFAKHEGNPEQNLFDMQCSWYELEVGACFEQKKEYGRSLKKFTAVAKHFDDIHEDQFDFHGYCLRKVTLRSYVSVLRFEDEVYGAEYYSQAAAGIIRIYLHLHDHPPVDEEAEPDYSQMTAAERKKAKAIARKKKKAAEKKKEANNNTTQNGNKKDNKGGGGAANKVVVDPDPLGKELVMIKDPLGEATKYSATLCRYAPKRIETWLLRYDVATRRNKPLMALQALHKARQIDPTNPELFVRIVAFASKLDEYSKAAASESVRTVLLEETPSLLNNNKSVDGYVKERADAIRTDPTSAPLPVRIALAKAVVSSSKGSSVSEAQELITNGGIDSCREVTVDTCRVALAAIRSFDESADSTKTKEWIAEVKTRFPLAGF